MSLLDGLFDDPNTRNGLRDSMGAIGLSLVSSPSNAPFANLGQGFAVMDKMGKGGMSKSALKALLMQAGFSDSEAETYSVSEASAKMALDLKKEQGFDALVASRFPGSGGSTTGGAGAPSISPAAPGGPAAGASLNGGTGSPLAGDLKLDDNHLDVAVRTVLAEAGNEGPAGRKAVAAVLRNRALLAGSSVAKEALAPNQFEPWNPNSNNDPRRFRVDSPEYQRTLAEIRPVLEGKEDPTGGATHFYAPKAQAALGRKPPKWDDGSGVDLGGHRFFRHAYGGRHPSSLANAQRPAGAPVQVAGGPGASMPIVDSRQPGFNPNDGVDPTAGFQPSATPTDPPANLADLPAAGAVPVAGNANPQFSIPAAPARPMPSDADERRQIEDDLRVIALSGKYGPRGAAFAKSIELGLAPRLKNLERPEQERLARAAGLTGSDLQRVLANSIPGNAPTGMQKEYEAYRAQKLAKGEAPLDQMEYELALKRAGATNVQVGGAEKANDAKVGEYYGKSFTDFQDQGRNATKLKGTLTLAERLIETPGFYSGPLAEKNLTLKSVIGSLGGDKNAPASMEAFRSLANRSVVETLGSLGAGVSNTDVLTLQTTVANLGNTPEGNKRIIEIQRKLADRQIEVARMARDYARKHSGRLDPGFDEELAQFAAANPLYPEERGAQSARGANGGPAPATTGQPAPAAAPAAAAPVRTAPTPQTQTEIAESIRAAQAYVAKYPTKRAAIIELLKAKGIPTGSLEGAR